AEERGTRRHGHHRAGRRLDCEPKDYTAAAGPAPGCRAVKTSVAPLNQPAGWGRTVTPVEDMERCQGPRCINLEDRAGAYAAAALRRAVEAAVACLDQCAGGIRAVTPVEAMKRRQRTRCIDLENRAVPRWAAILR